MVRNENREKEVVGDIKEGKRERIFHLIIHFNFVLFSLHKWNAKVKGGNLSMK